MRAALVEIATGLVVNIIVADASSDPAPEGFRLVNLAPGSTIRIGDTIAEG